MSTDDDNYSKWKIVRHDRPPGHSKYNIANASGRSPSKGYAGVKPYDYHQTNPQHLASNPYLSSSSTLRPYGGNAHLQPDGEGQYDSTLDPVRTSKRLRFPERENLEDDQTLYEKPFESRIIEQTQSEQTDESYKQHGEENSKVVVHEARRSARLQAKLSDGRGRRREEFIRSLPGPISQKTSAVDHIGVIPKGCLINIERTIPQELALQREIAEKLFKTHKWVYGLREEPYPINEVFKEWGRQWIIKQSQIVNGGMGLFAGEDILVEDGHTSFQYCEPLFPYAGPRYKKSIYKKLRKYYPIMKRYSMEIRDENPSGIMVVGIAREHNNLSAFINSSKGSKGKFHANAEWQSCNHKDEEFKPFKNFPKTIQGLLDRLQQQDVLPQYIMTVAVRTIQAGEEIFIDYPHSAV